ncbi:MAG: hypothetical protein EOP54_21610, partial [Sphingobacteriales bacterium]
MTDEFKLSFCGFVESNHSTLTVNQDIVINNQPASLSQCAGTNAIFTVTATAAIPISYQWWKGATPLSNGPDYTGVNLASLTVLNIDAADAGNDYYVVMTIAGGTCPQIVSANATLIVRPLPLITATPASVNICSNTAASIVLGSNVGGTTYSWTVVETGVTGATAGSGSGISQTLSTTGTTQGSVVYTITPTANGCPGPSAQVTIYVNPRPTFTTTVSPVSQIICSGSNADFIFTSNLLNTSYNWTVVQSGVSGASNNSGTSISHTLTTTGNVTGTAVYTITPVADGCNGTPQVYTITVNPIPNVVAVVTPASNIICSGATTNIVLSSAVTGTNFTWTASATGVTGSSGGTGASIAQTLNNTGTTDGTVTYTITPTYNGCIGTPIVRTITVRPAATIAATPTSQEICSGGTTAINLSGLSGSTYSWTVVQSGVTGATPNNGAAITQTLTNTGTVNGTATYTITPTAN